MNTYIILIEPCVALDCTTWEKVISRVDPVSFGVASRRMPLGGNLQELLNRVRVSHIGGALMKRSMKGIIRLMHKRGCRRIGVHIDAGEFFMASLFRNLRIPTRRWDTRVQKVHPETGLIMSMFITHPLHEVYIPRKGIRSVYDIGHSFVGENCGGSGYSVY
jgi:hypothetical protein